VCGEQQTIGTGTDERLLDDSTSLPLQVGHFPNMVGWRSRVVFPVARIGYEHTPYCDRSPRDLTRVGQLYPGDNRY
jgi:hypothetical protein